jgi:hypothetical protein
LLRTDIELASGLVRLYSKEQARSYLEAMLEYYRMKSEEYGQQMGGLLREAPPPSAEAKENRKEGKGGKEAGKVVARGWVKVGTLPVNTGDTAKALGEVTLKIVEEYKARVAKTGDALKSFNDLESINVGDGSAYTLFISRGVPDALIVSVSEKARAAFSFAAKFRTA